MRLYDALARRACAAAVMCEWDGLRKRGAFAQGGGFGGIINVSCRQAASE